MRSSEGSGALGALSLCVRLLSKDFGVQGLGLLGTVLIMVCSSTLVPYAGYSVAHYRIIPTPTVSQVRALFALGFEAFRGSEFLAMSDALCVEPHPKCHTQNVTTSTPKSPVTLCWPTSFHGDWLLPIKPESKTATPQSLTLEVGS